MEVVCLAHRVVRRIANGVSKGFTLIEVVMAIQVLAIGLSLLMTAYLYIVDHLALYDEWERQLAYERTFLHAIGRDIKNAQEAWIDQEQLYLLAIDGSRWKYSYKYSARRLDKAVRQKYEYDYYGRITMGVAIDFVYFVVDDTGVTVTYGINGSAEKQRYFRLYGLQR